MVTSIRQNARSALIDDLLENGERLIGQGGPIIPCNDKTPWDSYGGPARDWGLKPCTIERLRAGLNAAPNPTLGLLMGEKSGIIDVETDNDAEVESVNQLFEGCEPIITVAYDSIRGRHSLYAFDPRLAALETNAKGVFTYGAVKIRFGAGGKQVQSIIPPSPGRKWLPGLSLEDAEVKPLPEVVIQRLLDYAKSKKSEGNRGSGQQDSSQRVSGGQLLQAIRTATKNIDDGGDGSNRVFCCCCRGVEFDYSDAEIVAAIRDLEIERPFPRPWTDSAIKIRIRQAESKVTRGAALVVRRARTDMGNAERFAAMHGEKVRYVHLWKKWFVWDGTRWRMDDTGEVVRLAKLTARAIFREAEFADGKDDRDQILKWGQASQSRSRLEATLKLAESEQPIPVAIDSLDAYPWLLNCPNGTVDLTAGKLRPHDRGDLLTKSTGVEYPETPVASPLWQAFLDTTFAGNAELIGFVQRLIGSALPGTVLDHVLPIFYGGGANGKSVLIETVMAAMGDYAMKAPAGLLMTSRGERHPTELADLHGKRLVTICETGDGQKLDERLVKETTGGDTIRARRMREDFWEFKPTHLAILVTNHRPTVQGTDVGIWRRLRLVPFEVTIPEAKQDRRLPEKLRTELPAILRWMVEGCLEWLRVGLNAPEQVMLATEQYRRDSDTFQQWFDERMKVEGFGEVKASLALRNYLSYCEDQGEKPVSGTVFGTRMARVPGVTK